MCVVVPPGVLCALVVEVEPPKIQTRVEQVVDCSDCSGAGVWSVNQCQNGGDVNTSDTWETTHGIW